MPAGPTPLPQARARAAHPGRLLPLAIMTSDDTHQRTLDLLREHGHFGADPGQIHLIKQASTTMLSVFT